MGMIINPYRFGGDEVDTYISGLSTALSSDQVTRLRTLVSALKTGLSITNLSDVFDVFYIFAGETEESSLRNLVKRSHDATKSGSVSFTQYQGFTGGSPKYLNSNYNPSTQGVNYTQNNASLGIYSRTNNSQNSSESGISDGESISQLVLKYDAGGKAYMHINQTNATVVEAFNSNTSGLFITTRNGNLASNISFYRNKSNLGTGTGSNASSAVLSLNFFILCENTSGSPIAYSTKEISMWFAGKYISTAMRDTIVDAFEAYMDANGKGVIT